MSMQALRLLLLPLTLLGLAFSASCTLQALHPLYTASDTLRDARLTGAWADQDAAVAWEFSWAADSSDPAYRITYYEDDTSAELDGRLVELGGQLLLDLSPHDGQDANILALLLHVPVHTFMQVELEGDSLQLRAVDIEWLGAYLETHPDEIAHVWQTGSYEGMPLLTADTPELRSFMERHCNEPGVWGGPLQLQRMPTPEPWQETSEQAG